jgi:hypothetical protein
LSHSKQKMTFKDLSRRRRIFVKESSYGCFDVGDNAGSGRNYTKRSEVRGSDDALTPSTVLLASLGDASSPLPST